MHGHFSSVQGRLDALERIANSGIKTQASVTPLVGFKDFEGFARLFHQMGAYRVMVGELRTKFVGGGATKALSLDLGLPAPSETEALTFFSIANLCNTWLFSFDVPSQTLGNIFL